MERLVFSETPTVEIGSNRFLNVPVILQYDETPLIEVIKFKPAGFTTRMSIYHSDGTDLARVKGAQLYLTPAGRKAKLKLRHPPNGTVCELAGKTLFEIHRDGPATLKTYAEMYTPDGAFIKYADNPRPELIRCGKSFLQVGGVVMSGNLFRGLRIGIWVKSDGSVALGCS